MYKLKTENFSAYNIKSKMNKFKNLLELNNINSYCSKCNTFINNSLFKNYIYNIDITEFLEKTEISTSFYNKNKGRSRKKWNKILNDRLIICIKLFGDKINLYYPFFKDFTESYLKQKISILIYKIQYNLLNYDNISKNNQETKSCISEIVNLNNELNFKTELENIKNNSFEDLNMIFKLNENTNNEFTYNY